MRVPWDGVSESLTVMADCNKIKECVLRMELLKTISRLDWRSLRDNDRPFLLAPALAIVLGI